MDSGAHFYKCDLQVHTPRDINWKGQGAVTDEDRRQYARDFVAACRQKGIQAVAITDHHDVAFFRYIREAAQTETDETGKPLAANRRLVVFPGMELTLSVPCQALLILDADFPLELLPQVPQALSISVAPDQDANHAQTQRLEHIKAFEELYDELNKREFLRGHFIALPHVGESGTFTMLRSGFAAKYKNMPCVGGFVDGSVEQHGKGNKDILAGRNKDYGNKAIAIFQTSDNRSRNFSDLGKHVTWVKWAQPSAEALRQACLARESRISHTPPRIPSVRITRVEVTNSKFLGPLELDLNPQYNAVIGGRGTGKSTILEYLRWALCDQPPALTEGSELADFQRRRQGLIDNTLIPLNAAVDVFFLVDDVAHIVRRKAAGDLQLKIGDGPFQPCSEDNVRDLLPIRAYSQKQLSAVGARLEELRRFVHAPVRAQIIALEEEIAARRSELRSTFDRLSRMRALRLELTAHELERVSVTERLEKVRSSLKGLSPDDLAIIARQTSYVTEERLISTLERDAQNAKRALESATSELGHIPSVIDLTIATENPETIREAHAALDAWTTEAKRLVATLTDAFVEPTSTKALGSFFSAVGAWRRRREGHRKQHDEAARRAKAHEETIRQIGVLEARLNDINQFTDTKTEQLRRLGNPEQDFANARTEWTSLFSTRADLLAEQCSKLSATPSTRLRATLRRLQMLNPSPIA